MTEPANAAGHKPGGGFVFPERMAGGRTKISYIDFSNVFKISGLTFANNR